MDHIDLLQHHEIIRFDDVDKIFAEEGAMEAFLAARKAGKSGILVSPATKILTCISTCW